MKYNSEFQPRIGDRVYVPIEGCNTRMGKGYIAEIIDEEYVICRVGRKNWKEEVSELVYIHGESLWILIWNRIWHGI